MNATISLKPEPSVSVFVDDAGDYINSHYAEVFACVLLQRRLHYANQGFTPDVVKKPREQSEFPLKKPG